MIKLRLVELPLLACAALLLLTQSGGPAQAQQNIYTDQLAGGWSSYSWAAVKLDNTAPVHSGTDSISVTVGAGTYGALELRCDPLDASNYHAVTFWINGGPTGRQSQLVVKASVEAKQQGSVNIPTLSANKWTQVTVPLADLGTAATIQFTGILIQQSSADATPVFYVDDIQLTGPIKTVPQKPVIVRHVARPLLFTGVNLAGGEFDDPKPGVISQYGEKYIFPSTSELDYFAGKGANIIRFPFHWDDLQPVLNQPLDAAMLGRIKDVVKAANARGQIVLLDPHDYARYYGKVVGSPEVPDAAFADFWGRLASQFPTNPRVWIGLMNEPHDIPAAQWLSAANAAIASIRKVGAKNLILVPGTAWTGAQSWIGSGNAETMLGVVDPQNHYIFEVHQYLDTDNSGSHPEVVSATIGSERLKAFTLWCRQHHQRGFLGEFAAANNPTALLAAGDMLTYMEQNQDVWVGFTWWSAGAWWGDYMFTVEPKNGEDRPQMATLEPHLQKVPAPRIKVTNSR